MRLLSLACSGVLCLACSSMAVRRIYPAVVTSSNAGTPLPIEVIDQGDAQAAARGLVALGYRAPWLVADARTLAARMTAAQAAAGRALTDGLPARSVFRVAVSPGHLAIDAICERPADRRCR